MKKIDLRNGMVVEYRNGDKRVIISNVKTPDGKYYKLCFMGNNANWMPDEKYNDDLFCYNSDFDIVRIYEGDFNPFDALRNPGKLLWDRYKDKEVQSITTLHQEEKVLNLLADAWNEYLKLDIQHPNEKDYFADGMNLCQMAIGMRFARQNRPDLFPAKE